MKLSEATGEWGLATEESEGKLLQLLCMAERRKWDGEEKVGEGNMFLYHNLIRISLLSCLE